MLFDGTGRVPETFPFMELTNVPGIVTGATAKPTDDTLGGPSKEELRW